MSSANLLPSAQLPFERCLRLISPTCDDQRCLGACMAKANTPVASYDAIVIGTGQAGPPLARRLAAAGMTVAIIERGAFGGTCVNTGCIPTKALVASAYAAHMVRRASDFGVNVGPAAVDMKRVKARKDAIAGQSRIGVETWLETMERCTVYR